MSDLFQNDLFQNNNPWLLPVGAIVVLLLVWAVVRYIRARSGDFEHTISDISFDRVEGLIIPSADEGEILVDYLLLTSKGLLVLEVKDVQGTVFGGNKLQDWTVINNKRRYTFSNPQPALYDRIAAVRQIVRQVPVSGRILFLDGADFTKGTPELVSSLAQLVDEFGEPDKKAAKFKIDAFKPHWELIRKKALSTHS
jgi:hypothetical protein